MLSYGVFALWGCSPHAPGNMGCCIPNCASRRRKKATKRKYFAPPFQKNMRKFYARRAEFGIKRPAFTWGHGGGASPHIRTTPLANPRSLSAQKSTLWDATSYVAGGVGRAVPQTKAPHIQKPLRQLPKHSTLFFSVFCTFFMPERASFGIKRPAFTRGHGGGVSPPLRQNGIEVRRGRRDDFRDSGQYCG